mmetsp:Transcript_43572/g.136705  ORF Transcript_43572/g.136705 Transcript_43572/m.136705 type:complete len:332 (-) Transcript_43572:107-1102(-)
MRALLLAAAAAAALGAELDGVAERFARDGIAVVEGLVAHEVCDAMMARMGELLAAWSPSDAQSVFRTDGDQHVSDRYFFESAETVSFFLEPDAVNPDGTLKNGIAKEHAVNKAGHALHVLDDEFRAYATSPAVLDLVKALNYTNPVLPQSMYIFKQPYVGGAVTSHQDATFLYTEPRQTVLGIWLALEDATLENGCLWARRGSHLEPVRRHFCRKELVPAGEVPEMAFIDVGNEFGAGPKGEVEPSSFEGAMPEDLIAAGFESLPVKKGDAVLIHGQVDHLSLPNTSPKSRHTFQLHLIEGPEAGVEWHPGNWLQYASGPEAFPVMYGSAA